MADKYVMIFHDWPEATRMIGYQEKGRLIDAIVKYARGDNDWDDLLKGNEKYLFPMFQSQIDRSNAQREHAAQVHRASGKLGGRPRKNQNGFDENQKNQNGFSKTKKTYNKEEEEDKEEEKDNNIFDVDARGVTVQKYAAENLTTLGYRAMQEINGFIDDLSEDIVRHGIDNALDAGARNWSYVRAILNRYCDEGVKSVGEAKASDERFSKRKKDNDEPPERQQTITDELLYG